jgi:hypothetical protein
LQQLPLNDGPGLTFQVINVPWFRPTVYEPLPPGASLARRRTVTSTTVSIAGIDADGHLWLNGLSNDRGTWTYRTEVVDLATGQILVSQPSPRGAIKLLHRSTMALTAIGSADLANLTYILWQARIVRQ